MHPPYSPDLAASNDYLFLSMANDFTAEKYGTREVSETQLSQVLANGDVGFYECNIMTLP